MQAIQRTAISGLIIFGLLFTTNSMATANTDAKIQAPDVILKATTLDMLRSINADREALDNAPDKLKLLVEKIILPQIDFIAASKLVLGKYWRRADQKQKIQFIRQFRTVLLRFYSAAIYEYVSNKNEALPEDLFHYFPLNAKPEDSSTTVRAELKSDSGQVIPIHYRMHMTSKGWKIYDVSVEGISIITTYKNNFATELETKGIDDLIASLEEKNNKQIANNDKK